MNKVPETLYFTAIPSQNFVECFSEGMALARERNTTITHYIDANIQYTHQCIL